MLSETKRCMPMAKTREEQPDTTKFTLTKERIVQACVKQGFFRTPACNEKLYLHHMTVEKIDPRAFSEYTEVKVLWLDHNLLKQLPNESQVSTRAADQENSVERTVVREALKDELATPTAPREYEATRSVDFEKADVATPPAHRQAAAVVGYSKSGSNARAVDPVSGASDGGLPARKEETDADSSVTGGEGIASLYPSLRQLYLNNNLFSEMPNLRRFHQLDSLNLSNNSISRIRTGCVFWEAENACGETIRREVATMDRERRQNGVSKSSMTEERRAPVDEVSTKTQEQLQEEIDRWVTLCKHEAWDPDYETRTKLQRGRLRLWEVAPATDGAARHVDPCSDGSSHAMGPKRGEGQLGAPDKSECDVRRYDIGKHQCVCATLSTLNLSGNHLRTVHDLREILCFKRLISLDLSNNLLEDGEAVLLLLSRMPHTQEQLPPGTPDCNTLRSLKLFGNPLVRTLTNYRRRVLSAIPSLLHLDDRPVFEDERRLVTAWAAGGAEAERLEKRRMKTEREKKERERLEAFRELIRQSSQPSSKPAAGNGAVATRHSQRVASSVPQSKSAAAQSENAAGAASEVHATEGHRGPISPCSSATSTDSAWSTSSQGSHNGDDGDCAAEAAAAARPSPLPSSSDSEHLRTTESRTPRTNATLGCDSEDIWMP